MNTSDIHAMIRYARVHAAERMPWFATGLFAAPLVITESCPSLAAIDNRMRIYFNPLHCKTLIQSVDRHSAIRQLAYVWIHELNHALRDHATRATKASATARLWNVAADLEINDSDWPGIEPPVCFPPLTPQQFQLPVGKFVEYYYHALCARTEYRQSIGMGDSIPEQFADEGSGVHDQPRCWESPVDKGQAHDEGVSSLEQDHWRRQVAELIQRDKRRTIIPGCLLRWSDARCRSTTDWRSRLGSLARTTAATWALRQDYSFRRPHRRAFQFLPVVRPRLECHAPPHVAIVVDTSGSMSAEELGQAVSEVCAVLRVVNGPITVIPCDSVAHSTLRVTSSNAVARLRESLVGGGGTDMRVGIQAALDLRPAPSLVLVLTDGYTPFPVRRPQTPVVFGIFSSTNQRFGGTGEQPLPPMPPWSKTNVVMIDRAH